MIDNIMTSSHFQFQTNSSYRIEITFQNPDNPGTEIPIPGFYSWFPKGLSTCTYFRYLGRSHRTSFDINSTKKYVFKEMDIFCTTFN